MNVIKTAIDGVVIIELRIYENAALNGVLRLANRQNRAQ